MSLSNNCMVCDWTPEIADAAITSSDVLFSSTWFVTEKLTTLLLIFYSHSINLKMQMSSLHTHAHAHARAHSHTHTHARTRVPRHLIRTRSATTLLPVIATTQVAVITFMCFTMSVKQLRTTISVRI